MAKKLKIGFAMGGGVSLGTFSGAALTEAIKLLIVENKYETIEIDVMSGASAGAISLGVMLRAFMSHDDILERLKEYPYQDNSIDIKVAIKDKLKKQFGTRYDALNENKKEQLFTAQVVQDFEQLIWCKAIDIVELAGMGNNSKDLSLIGSLLDKGYIEKMAADFVLPKSDTLAINNRKNGLLAKRVLLASTLTRLESNKITSTLTENPFGNSPINDLYKDLYEDILQDAITSYIHRDVRVFDINFERPDNLDWTKDYPTRWLLGLNNEISEFQNSVPTERKPVFYIQDKDFWANLIATSIAAGTFPVAFEPTLLTRYATELGTTENQQYSYIDGGTFNNEPINEAFRLAAIIDATDNGKIGEDFDRFIFFVDPLISQDSRVRMQSFYNNYKLIDNQITPILGINKIMDFVNPMISVLRSEGSVSPLDISNVIYNRFENKSTIKGFIHNLININIPSTVAEFENPRGAKVTMVEAQIALLVKSIEVELREQFKNIMIPAISPSLKSEIRRIILDKENNEYFVPQLIAELTDNAITSGSLAGEDYDRFFVTNTISGVRFFKDWLKSLFFAYIDIVIDLSGKNPKTILIPIGPIELKEKKNKKEKRFNLIELKGAKVQAFYGFFDRRIREYDFYQGTSSAYNVLSGLHLTTASGKLNWQDFKNDFAVQENSIKDDIKKTLGKVVKKRLGDEIYKGFLAEKLIGKKKWVVILAHLFESLGKRGVNTLAEKLVSQILEEKEKTFELEMRIKVPAGFLIRNVIETEDTISNIAIKGETYLVFVHQAERENSGYKWIESPFVSVAENGIMSLFIFKEDDETINSTVLLPTKEDIENALESSANPLFVLDLENILGSIELLQQRAVKIATQEKDDWALITSFQPLEQALLLF
jgi:predicted acylesterase/phospholipase RssA